MNATGFIAGFGRILTLAETLLLPWLRWLLRLPDPSHCPKENAEFDREGSAGRTITERVGIVNLMVCV